MPPRLGLVVAALGGSFSSRLRRGVSMRGVSMRGGGGGVSSSGGGLLGRLAASGGQHEASHQKETEELLHCVCDGVKIRTKLRSCRNCQKKS